jgi:hypothetical protein
MILAGRLMQFSSTTFAIHLLIMTKKQSVFSIRSVLAVTATLFLSVACGGGGDNSSSPPPPAIPVAATPPVNPPVVTNPPAIDPAVLAAQPGLSDKPMDEIVNTKLIPVLDNLFNLVKKDGLNTTMQGVKVFDQPASGGDKFLPGKVAIGFGYLLLTTDKTDPKFAGYLEGYRSIADTTVNLTNETWGIYYYLSALAKLKNAGLLEGTNPAVSTATMAKLQTQLDWRNFVTGPSTTTPTYTLKGTLPTNYYGVAFSVARLRYTLGWEDAVASEGLLKKVIEHYSSFSKYGFSDETDGDGRFDRYSILLIGEIMQRITETNMEVNPKDYADLKGWLRQATDVLMLRLNVSGNGFDFGRSLSPYGDTAFAEVLSAAQVHGVMTPAETDIAYAFATRITAKYAQFWYDDELKTVNLWYKGRAADGYRGTWRILGENLSLSHQLIYTNNLWKKAGYATKAPVGTQKLLDHIQAQKKSTLTKFAGFDGQATTYDRGLVTYLDGLRIFSLPVVSGAKEYHRTNSYFALPYSSNLISGAPDKLWPQLQPQFSFAGAPTVSWAIPAAYQKNLVMQPSADGKTLAVNYKQDELDFVTPGVVASKSFPVKDTRLASVTAYTFEPGRITRIDTYTPNGTQSLAKIEMEFGSFSKQPTAQGKLFSYASGDVTSFEVTGLETCVTADVSTDANYYTPTGPLQTTIRCSSPAQVVDKPFTIKWVLTYRAGTTASFAPK